MLNIFEEDIFGEGKKQIVISNNMLKAVIIPNVGGRIAQIQNGETQFLYSTYPQGTPFGPYTEYGGIEECIGSAPGNLWNVPFHWEKKDNGVLLQTTSRSILLRKHITLDESEPIIKIKYDLMNLGNTFSRLTFGIHPEISINGSFKDNKYHIPSKQELINGGYEGAGTKKSVPSDDGWCAVTYKDKVFGQMFPIETIESIEVYYPRVNTHLVLQPMIFGVGIAPDMKASFNYMIYAGNGEAKLIKETREWLNAEFFNVYEPFDKKEIPENIMFAVPSVHHGTVVEVNPFGNIAPELMHAKEVFDNMGKNKIPKANIPNMKSIIEEQKRIQEKIQRDVEREMRRANREIEMTQREIERTNRERERIIREMENQKKREQRERERANRQRERNLETGDNDGKTFGTNAKKLVVRHLNGDVSINTWDDQEHQNIGFGINGRCRDENETVIFETSGELSLDIPQRIADIDLSFVNGTANIANYSSKLHVSGINGTIDVNMNGLPDNESVSMSLVSGDIKLCLPANSSCTIRATCSIGKVNCDLPIKEEIKTQTELKGILNNGSTKITLSVVKGDIYIGSA